MYQTLRPAIYRSREHAFEVEGLARNTQTEGLIHFETKVSNIPAHLRKEWELTEGETVQLIAGKAEIEWIKQ